MAKQEKQNIKIDYLDNDRVNISDPKEKLGFEMATHSFKHLCGAWNLTEAQCATKMLAKKGVSVSKTKKKP